MVKIVILTVPEVSSLIVWRVRDVTRGLEVLSRVLPVVRVEVNMIPGGLDNSVITS